MRLQIAVVVLILASSLACGQSTPATPSPTTSSSTSTVAASIVSGSSTLTTTAYAPNPVVVAVGGTVSWTNNDTKTHTSTADGGQWSSGPIAPGGTFNMMFTSAGTFPYHCTIHPGMVGTVRVQ